MAIKVDMNLVKFCIAFLLLITYGRIVTGNQTGAPSNSTKTTKSPQVSVPTDTTTTTTTKSSQGPTTKKVPDKVATTSPMPKDQDINNTTADIGLVNETSSAELNGTESSTVKPSSTKSKKTSIKTTVKPSSLTTTKITKIPIKSSAVNSSSTKTTSVKSTVQPSASKMPIKSSTTKNSTTVSTTSTTTTTTESDIKEISTEAEINVGQEEVDFKPKTNVQYNPDNTVEDEDSGTHFMAYFITFVVIVIAGYIIYHNKQKILAFILEGRKEGGGSRRRPNSKEYKRLKTEEVMPSLEKNASDNKYIY